ncbi:hypothetical protein [Glaciihabitans sp. GrIS 2.15]|uniref:hypothetical protein n=1 Tax=Glaciihabitans sp. GrIS 2.15 TaxID=3071710 RepID=UPI002E038234|nr:hypothetical protein [Glaciihabitans sp. GrIS 2.15]
MHRRIHHLAQTTDLFQIHRIDLEIIRHNSPFALLAHRLGVVEAWVRGFVAGRHIEQDLDAEFLATGRVQPLLARAEMIRGRFRIDVMAADPESPLASEPPAECDGPPRTLNTGAALQHVYEELARHYGQTEQMRDVIHAVSRGDLVLAR